MKAILNMTILTTTRDYRTLILGLEKSSSEEKRQVIRHLSRTDLYFLLWYTLKRDDIEHQWTLDRCIEVQKDPNGHIDLWAREHYKSTVITFAKTIQDIIRSHGENPIESREITVGIFSHTRPIAKGFMRQIKRELETNEILKWAFDDVFYQNPQKESPKWSEDDGLIVKRKSNPKESTVEAWGLVDGQPTSKHYGLLMYDDVVTIDSVRSPDMIAKTTEAWELSTNLGEEGGVTRIAGTRYHYNDTYCTIMDRKAAIPRIHPATHNGQIDGEPVLKSKAWLNDKRLKQGSYVFACQQLLDPKADNTQGFKLAWVQYTDQKSTGAGMNKYILVDPANEKTKKSDYTSMWVIGLGADGNYYVLDIVRDKLSLNERVMLVIDLHRKWKPLGVGYEKYGMQSDISYLKEKMEEQEYRFKVTPLGGSMAKNDRIRRLIPLFESERFYFPKEYRRTNYEGKSEELVEIFIDSEYQEFPVAAHDDMLDALARITDEDMKAIFPKQRAISTAPKVTGYMDGYSNPQGWMA